jgi:polyhydroxyalkanoate synthesis repressor PhaR
VDGKLTLKKYSNRRLYDTERSAYITLAEVASMVREGRRIEVIDDQTKQDVTARILHQIILEDASTNSYLPVSFLHLLVRYGGRALNDFLENYLAVTLKNYLSYRKTFDAQFSRWLELGAGVSDHLQEQASGFTAPVATPPETQPPEKGKGKKNKKGR